MKAIDNKELIIALEELEKEKGIKKEELLESIRTALITAYKRNFDALENVDVKMDEQTGATHVYAIKEVMERANDDALEISLEDARKINKELNLGDSVEVEIVPRDFGRIAAQTAKQVVMQKLKEMERQIATSELSEKEDELLTTVVKRIDNGVVYVQIAGSHSEGVMLETDQIPGEKFHEGDRIKVYVKRIKDGLHGPQIQVSRSNIGFVRKMFELEVPEIASGEVVIKNIARDAGNRTKVAVFSDKPNIDAVGACVGNRGVRINTIVSELNGEKIDLVLYSDDPLEYIARALSPAKIISVETNDSLKASRVIVPDDKLSLAIGRSGQNVRLAARLTGWKIDVKPESQVAKEETSPEVEYEITDIADDNALSDFDSFDSMDDLEEINLDEE